MKISNVDEFIIMIFIYLFCRLCHNAAVRSFERMSTIIGWGSTQYGQLGSGAKEEGKVGHAYI